MAASTLPPDPDYLPKLMKQLVDVIDDLQLPALIDRSDKPRALPGAGGKTPRASQKAGWGVTAAFLTMPDERMVR